MNSRQWNWETSQGVRYHFEIVGILGMEGIQ